MAKRCSVTLTAEIPACGSVAEPSGRRSRSPPRPESGSTVHDTPAGIDPIGSIPAGVSWTVLPDSGRGGLRLRRPDGSATEPHAGISAVNVTEHRFAMADGRRYRGRINVIRDAS